MVTRNGERSGGRLKGTPNRPKVAAELPTKPGWLFVATQGVLISPFATRPDGPTGAEIDAILMMQRRLKKAPATVWVDPNSGQIQAHTVSADVLAKKATDLTTVRMRHYRPAA